MWTYSIIPQIQKHILLHNEEEFWSLRTRMRQNVVQLVRCAGGVCRRFFLATLPSDCVSCTAPACWSWYGNDNPSRFYADSA